MLHLEPVVENLYLKVKLPAVYPVFVPVDLYAHSRKLQHLLMLMLAHATNLVENPVA